MCVWVGGERGEKPPPREKRTMVKGISCGAGGRGRFKMADVEGRAVRAMGPGLREGTGVRPEFCEGGSPGAAAVGARCLSCPGSAVCLWRL